jgi:ankyrin repeat protein
MKRSPKQILSLAWKNIWTDLENIASYTHSNDNTILDYCGDAGDTIFHAAASHGKLNIFSEEQMTEKRLLISSYNNITPLYLACVRGNLEQVPASRLREEILAQHYGKEGTLLEIIIKHGYLYQLKRDLFKESMLLWATSDGKKIVHHIADYGGMDYLCPEYLTRKLIMTKDDIGNTVAFFMARSGQLDLLNDKILSKEDSLYQNNWGETLLHWAMSCGKLSHLPKDLLTRKAISIENKRGENLIHLGIMCGLIDEIPKKYLTQATMLKRSSTYKSLGGKTSGTPSPMEVIMANLPNDSNRKIFRQTLSKLSLSKLKRLPTVGKSLYLKDIKREMTLRQILKDKSNTLSL